MNQQAVEADYVVVGCGAMGMAFADVILTETDASVVMVDRHDRPGGHWNDAYPFVRLHQPSAFYGVNSRQLGDDGLDQTGLNQGLREVASSGEICGYFDQVMQKQFLPTGRMQYFPMCDYSDGRATSSVTGESFTITARRKVVDATYTNTSVPSTQAPQYEVASGVTCVPPNALPSLEQAWAEYAVIGAGKTAMDACLWLLANGVPPEKIRWIMPRDAWLLDRANIQPGDEFFISRVGDAAAQMESIVKAESVEHLFELLNECGVLLRLDDSITPTMYRCATVSKPELDQLKRIENIVRLGRVTRIDPGQIVLEEGVVDTGVDVLHIDCTADGLKQKPPVPVFQDNRITLQNVRVCQPTFSAAFIGHVEAALDDEAKKNEVCTPVPYPNSDIDWLKTTLANLSSMNRCANDAELQAWATDSRLNFAAIKGYVKTMEPAKQAVLQRYLDNAESAATKLQRLLEDASPT